MCDRRILSSDPHDWEELALEHAAGRVEDSVYLQRMHELRDAKENPRAHER